MLLCLFPSKVLSPHQTSRVSAPMHRIELPQPQMNPSCKVLAEEAKDRTGSVADVLPTYSKMSAHLAESGLFLYNVPLGSEAGAQRATPALGHRVSARPPRCLEARAGQALQRQLCSFRLGFRSPPGGPGPSPASSLSPRRGDPRVQEAGLLRGEAGAHVALRSRCLSPTSPGGRPWPPPAAPTPGPS